ncbi:hypothetical protein APHAL10511_007083 [Amanita phalloides]|nr:hypothetical protein APHAL10511_007083 [Amanita phalloides]
MHSSSGSKDRCSLHRWVLLKNSLSIYSPLSANPAPNQYNDVNLVESHDHSDDQVEAGAEDGDSFLFPDAGHLVSTSQSGGSEAQWLDTLLKALADDEDEDDLGEADTIAPAMPVEEDDEDDTPLSPLSSPMASSDDLNNQATYFTPDLAAVSYHISYPSQPSLLRSYQDVPSSISALPAPYEDPLPYHDLDYVPDYAMLEDASDDESDTPSTPSFGRSSTSLTLADSPSTPTERNTLHHTKNHLYSHKDALFLPFETDPLPFSHSYREFYLLFDPLLDLFDVGFLYVVLLCLC